MFQYPATELTFLLDCRLEYVLYVCTDGPADPSPVDIRDSIFGCRLSLQSTSKNTQFYRIFNLYRRMPGNSHSIYNASGTEQPYTWSQYDHSSYPQSTPRIDLKPND